MRRQNPESPVCFPDQAKSSPSLPISPQDQAPPTFQALSLTTSENEHSLLSHKKDVSHVTLEFEAPTNELSSSNNVCG